MNQNVDTVRLLIADLDPDNRLMRDQDLDVFLTLNDSDVYLAAAAALDTIATSEALLSKKIRTQDLATDGPAVAAELRARAGQLREQSADAGWSVAVTDFDPGL